MALVLLVRFKQRVHTGIRQSSRSHRGGRAEQQRRLQQNGTAEGEAPDAGEGGSPSLAVCHAELQSRGQRLPLYGMRM